MGKMADYADQKKFEVLAAKGLIENFGQLLHMRESLTSEIGEMTKVLQEMHTELTNVEYMLFEVKEQLETRGIKVE